MEALELLLDQAVSLLRVMTDTLIMSIIGCETETIIDNEMEKDPSGSSDTLYNCPD